MSSALVDDPTQQVPLVRPPVDTDWLKLEAREAAGRETRGQVRAFTLRRRPSWNLLGQLGFAAMADVGLYLWQGTPVTLMVTGVVGVAVLALREAGLI